MVPGNKFDKPAKSPFMDMMLVPAYADSGADGSQVTVSSRIQQNLGLRTAEVTEGTLAPSIDAVGNIDFNERDQVIVQARAGGFVEKLFVRATLDAVVKGQPLAELYLPDWVAAQEEFLAVARMQGADLGALVDGARRRMRQVGMNDAQIAAVDSSGRVQPRFTVTAPIGGVLTELMLREGMTVAAGATLLRINGLGTVRAHAEVPESQAALLRPGARAQASSPAVPGKTFEGTVQAIVPEVNSASRTLKARVQLDNPGGRLRARHVRADADHGPAHGADAAGAHRSHRADRQTHAGDAGRRPRPLPAGRGADRHRERRADRDHARPESRAEGGRVGAVPDRQRGRA